MEFNDFGYVLDRQHTQNSLKTLFSKAKTPKIFRALRAQGGLKSKNFPNLPGGVSKIFACGAICVGGVLKIMAYGHIGGGGVYKEGGFNNNSVVPYWNPGTGYYHNRL